MIALQQMQTAAAAREQALIDTPPLTNEELISLFDDSGVPLSTESKSKKKKSKSKK